MASDAIVVGEEWISEHYFTTDATKESFKARVLVRRAEWDALKEQGTPRTRFSTARTSLLNRFATLDGSDESHHTDIRALNADLRALLGYDAIGLSRHTHGPVTFVQASGLEHTPGLAIVDALPAETIEELLAKDADNLVEPFVPGDPSDHADASDKDAVRSVARLLSLLFVHEDYKPAFVLVLAGPHVLVAERERWPEGRYLAVDLQLVAERNDDKRGGEVDRALTCLAADSLAPDAQGDIWWSATLAESVKHTVGVSKDLREGVRLSVEIIANEVVSRRKAQGLEPLPAQEAQPLAKQSLRFLYRILFLLYAEASPELGVLPAGSPEYENGYSLDRLRELVLVELPTQRSRAGTHLYESLGALFRLVDQGHDPSDPEGTEGEYVAGLTFRSLRADLFKPEATAHIDEVGLGNSALQQVLRHLLLSKEQKGRDRGFISYAELGINQLGAVYEGLMSYTGFFAETDLYEVAKDGNAEKGSWVVPVSRAEGIAEKDFVTVEDEHGQPRPVLHPQGTFVFRLAGRERQQSASYYTPEVLTRFVVSQALEELLDQDGSKTTAAEILDLTICEPALGSGAFAIEAVRQLAEQYLARRQEELGETIDPDAYPRELQRVKAYLALHQVYGVDLNATAVELAEISLWLDTMVEGLHAPWFGLHLRRGNSLIGARKAVYSRAQVADKAWLSAAPKPVRASSVEPDETTVERIEGWVPHFLLPAEGWGAAANVGKDIKDLVPDAVAALKKWRRSVQAKPGKKQADALVDLGRRVERLWEITSRRLEIAEDQIRRDIPLWGHPLVEPVETSNEKRGTSVSKPPPQPGRHVTREEIEASLADPDSAYRRLKLVMDAWCALWFWPLTEAVVAPPTLEQWYEALRMILGADTMSARQAKKGDDTLGTSYDWDQLGDLEQNDRVYADAKRIADVLGTHPWLEVCQRVAEQQGFFHWQLEFAPVFDRGGFDLQVGNPPWVRPDDDEDGLLSEADPWWRLAAKPSQAEKRARRVDTLKIPGASGYVVDGTVELVAIRGFLGSETLYPYLVSLRPDLYRSFIEQAWRSRSPIGVTALIHPESHFTEQKAGPLRAGVYRRLRRHWQFINELTLFEVHHLVSYGVHVYGAPLAEPRFLMATSLYHPETVARSMVHDGSGAEPGLKDGDGNWDVKPHRLRVVTVDSEMLATWHSILEDAATPILQTRMIFSVNQTTTSVLKKLASAPRIGSALPIEFCMGWEEFRDRVKGRFALNWGRPDDWIDAILQGPHIHVANPMYKTPNSTMRNNLDWSLIDLDSLDAQAVPITAYKPAQDRNVFEGAFTHWGEGPTRTSSTALYRVAWRAMAANTGERTLIPAVIPPGPTHVHAVFAVGSPRMSARDVLWTLGMAVSLLADMSIRVAPKSGINRTEFERIPSAPREHPLGIELVARAARLTCLVDSYAALWRDASVSPGDVTPWSGGIDYAGRPALDDLPSDWTAVVPLRRASDRRQALVEIDALVALMLDVTADELCTIYRTQFPVLYGYDRNKYVYDVNGREVPTSILQTWRKKGLDESSIEGLTEDERTAVHPGSGIAYVYELPFRTLDREADMRTAYAHFEKVLAERTGT